MKNKEQVLLENGWELIIGHELDYERDADQSYVIVERKDVEKFFHEPPNKYYWHENDDCTRDLDDAWECFLDDKAYDLNIDCEDVEKEFLECEKE